MRNGTSGVRTGISKRIDDDVIVVPYNDLEAAGQAFQHYGNELAAVIVEPVATNMGLVPGTKEFLTRLRAFCDEHGAILIFDEVVSGFRFCYGAASNLMDIRPDLTAFGKIIGGGTPVGAYGGRTEIMSLVGRQGGVFQGGTFAGNPLTMAAGLATLKVLANGDVYDKLDHLGKRYEQTTLDLFRRYRLPFNMVRLGSLLSYVLIPGVERCNNFNDVTHQDRALFRRLHFHMANHGFLLPPTIEEPIFISAAHTFEQVTRCAQLAAEFIMSSTSEVSQPP
jgi:glutamate-1-semialdehyde 2,1-aminomutase